MPQPWPDKSARLLLGQTRTEKPPPNTVLHRAPQMRAITLILQTGKADKAELDRFLQIPSANQQQSRDHSLSQWAGLSFWKQKDAACRILQSFTSFPGCITRLNESLHKRLRIQRKQRSASAQKNAGWDPKIPIQRSVLSQAGLTADKVFLTGEGITGSTVPHPYRHRAADRGATPHRLREAHTQRNTRGGENKDVSAPSTTGRSYTITRARQMEEGASPS